MNCWTGTGRLTKKPEMRKGAAEDSYVVRAIIAVDREYKSEGKPNADFIPLVIYGKRGKTFATYLDKGSKIAVRGRITTDSYEKDGKTQYSWCVTVDSFEFLDKKSDGKGPDAEKKSQYAAGPAPEVSDEDFLKGLQNMTDDDLPWS